MSARGGEYRSPSRANYTARTATNVTLDANKGHNIAFAIHPALCVTGLLVYKS